MKSFLVTLHWNEATEEWRMETKGLTIQENKGDAIPNPKGFYNCFSINMMFEGLDKTKPKKYKMSIEPEAELNKLKGTDLKHDNRENETGE